MNHPSRAKFLQSTVCPGSGPTKAHRIYLKHVIREYRAQEKRLAAHLLKFALPFLEVLRDVKEEMKIFAEMLPCFSLLLETFNGLPFSAGDVCPHHLTALHVYVRASSRLFMALAGVLMSHEQSAMMSWWLTCVSVA